MAVTAYREADFQGLVARLGPGLHSGRGIVGCPHRSTNCEEEMPVGSLRVEPNTVVCVSASRTLGAQGGGARVLLGPAEAPSLAALGLPRVGAVLVAPFRPYDGAEPLGRGGVDVYSSPWRGGIPAALPRGDYPASRLASEEVRARGVASLVVAGGAVALLYSGAALEADQDAVAVVGPAVVDDVETSLGLTVRSLRVLVGTVPAFPTRGLPGAAAAAPGGLPSGVPGAGLSASAFGDSEENPRIGLGGGAGPARAPAPAPARPREPPAAEAAAEDAARAAAAAEDAAAEARAAAAEARRLTAAKSGGGRGRAGLPLLALLVLLLAALLLGGALRGRGGAPGGVDTAALALAATAGGAPTAPTQ